MPLRVGIDGPVGAGKTALITKLCKQMRDRFPRLKLIFVESAGNAPRAKRVDLTLYVIDISAGDEIPIGTPPDLLIVNKIDLAGSAGANLGRMEKTLRAQREGRPFLFNTMKGNQGVDYIASFIAEKIALPVD